MKQFLANFFYISKIFAINVLTHNILNSSSNGNIKLAYSTLTDRTANCKAFDKRGSS